MGHAGHWSEVVEIAKPERAATAATAATDLRSMIQAVPGAPARSQRRLPERILVAAHQACDLGEFAVAGSLLSILEIVLMQPASHPAGSYRRSVEGMVAAYERLWHLRHDAGQADPSASLARAELG